MGKLKITIECGHEKEVFEMDFLDDTCEEQAFACTKSSTVKLLKTLAYLDERAEQYRSWGGKRYGFAGWYAEI